MNPPKAEDIAVGRRPEVEAWLDERGVKWAFDPAFPTKAVNEKRSLANQARLEPLDPEVVARYTDDVRRGDQFPAVLANRRPRVKDVELLGGNHRFRAFLNAGRDTIPAYVVSVEPEMALRLIYEDNRRHGLPPSEVERIMQAIHLCDNGWTLEQAAATVGVAAPRVSQERTMVRATRRAKALDVDVGFHKLPRWSKYALGRLRSDPVFKTAAELAVRAKLSVDEVKALCVRLQDARSDADALSLLEMETEELRSRIGGSAGGRVRATRTPRAVLAVAMREICARDAADVVASIPTADARAEMRKEVDRTIEHLTAVRKALR